MNFSLKVLLMIVTFFLFHLLDIWPLPVPFQTLVSEVTTLLFFVEIAFYIYYRTHIKQLQWFHEPPSYSDSRTPELRARTFASLLNTMSLRTWGDCGDANSSLTRWFLGTVAHARDLRRGNVIQWLAWACFYRLPTQLSPAEARELAAMVDTLQERVGVVFPPGLDPAQKSMRLTLDPVSAMHRPLLLYSAQAVSSSVSKLVLRLAFGFTRKKLGGFHYWHKIRSDAQRRDKLPLVFIHGLGQGLLAYLHFLYHVRDRDVFLVELSHISARVWERVPEVKEVASFVESMLQEHNYSRAVFMSHSFGTFATTWCIKYRPHIVHSAMLIDPVTLMLCYPTTCHVFVYRQPQSVADWIRRCLISQEMGIVRVMRRHFWWRENALFVEDLPAAVAPPACADRYAYYPSDAVAASPAPAATAAAGGCGDAQRQPQQQHPESDACLLDAYWPSSPVASPTAPTVHTHTHDRSSASARASSARPSTNGPAALSVARARPALPFAPVASEVDPYGVFPLCGLRYDPAAGRGLGQWAPHEADKMLSSSVNTPVNTTANTVNTVNAVNTSANSIGSGAKVAKSAGRTRLTDGDARMSANTLDTDADTADDTGATAESDYSPAAAAAVLAQAAPRIKLVLALAGQDDLLPADRILNHFRLHHAAAHGPLLAALAARFPPPAAAAALAAEAAARGEAPAEGAYWGPGTAVPLARRGKSPRPEQEWDALLPDTLERYKNANKDDKKDKSSETGAAVGAASTSAGAGAVPELDVAGAEQALKDAVRVRVLYEPDGGHGHCLMSAATRGRVLSLVPWLADEE